MAQGQFNNRQKDIARVLRDKLARPPVQNSRSGGFKPGKPSAGFSVPRKGRS